MKRRGQFFLIAALLISGMTIGFGTLYNSATIVRGDTQAYQLSEQLHSEVQQAYDAGTFSATGTQDPKQLAANNVKQIVNYYSAQNPDSNFAIVYGDANGVQTICSNQGNVETEGSTGCPKSVTSPSTGAQGPSASQQNGQAANQPRHVKVDIKFTESGAGNTNAQNQKQETLDKEFDIQSGQNFYVVVRKKVKNEQVVIYR